MHRFAQLCCSALLACVPALAQAAPVAIVAAENFYGDVARQIAGPGARISSILNNPNADPHLFEVSPSNAREIAGADLVIYNGAGYDPWMSRLLSAGSSTHRRSINVAQLLQVPAGADPHLWYEPAAMPVVARALAAALEAADPAHAQAYQQQLRSFLASLRPLQRCIAQLRARYAGTAVTATEPVFDYMAASLGLKMQDRAFQLAVMNNTEPSAADTAAFIRELEAHAVRALIYNTQASDPAAQQLLHIARDSGVPVVGVSETEPPDQSYQNWMLSQLATLERALAKSAA